jgi:PEP-CTERM motif
MRNLLLAAAATAITLASLPAQASPVLQGNSTTLTGIQGLVVDGTAYDVTFVDGTCSGIYGACDAAHFDFQDSAVAKDAAISILAAIAGGYFDTNVGTVGCSSIIDCEMLVPYGTGTFGGQPLFFTAAAFNLYTQADSESNIGKPIDSDTQTDGRVVFAKFGPPSVTAVPEPVTLSLFGAGFASAVVLRRRKKNA